MKIETDQSVFKGIVKNDIVSAAKHVEEYRRVGHEHEAKALMVLGRRIVEVNGLTIETWWDRQSQNWITQIKDADGCDVESGKFTEYSGNKLDAAISHCWAIIEASEFGK